jgi:predicted nucleotidyltransferase
MERSFDMEIRNEKDISSLTNAERQAIREFKNRIYLEFPNSKLILFGSKARGDHHVYSDIDLLLVGPYKKNAKNRSKIGDIAFDVNFHFGTGISCIMQEEDGWEDLNHINAPFLVNVRSEGVIIEVF